MITRFAPSPTGKMHIGSARTALFNYLLARRNGGKFLLRIEDTDQARSTVEHIDDIKESLTWLKLDWDNLNSEHYQSKRLEIYQKVAQELVSKGFAEEREGAIYFKIPSTKSQIPNKSQAPNSKQEENNSPHQSLPLVRGGEEGLDSIIFDDLIHGKISTAIENIEDFVILKSDGYPTFHLGVVVDDHDMGVTHIIRGDDHLSNTPRHILLYRALGWDLPQWGHLPLILNKDRSKMSKRKDPVSVTEDYRKKGYLPEALVNYLALLGWSPKTDEEFFTLVELVEKFDIKNVQKSNAVFDHEKLNHFNAYYLRKLPIKVLLKYAKSVWKNQFEISKYPDPYLEKVVTLIIERIQTINDFGKDIGYFFLVPKLEYDNLIFGKSTAAATLRGLETACDMLNTLAPENWEVEELHKTLMAIVERTGLTNGDVFWPVRYALSGEKFSPKPEEIMYVLGKDESLRRIDTAKRLLQ